MEKIFFALLISLSFINSNILDTYVIEPYKMGEYSKQSACVCLQLHKDTKKESNPFYLSISADKQNDVKMDKIIYYDFKNSCDNLPNCTDDTYKNLKKNNNMNTDLETSNSFFYEYKCDLDDDSHRAFYIQYREFTGNNIKIQYAPFTTSSLLYVLLIIVGIIIFIIIIIIIFACRYCQKKKQERLNAEFLATHQDLFNNSEVPIVPEDTQALFPGQYQAIVPQENQAIVPQ